MEHGVTARPGAIGGNGPEAALSRAARGGNPLAIFPPEQKVDKGSGDDAVLRQDATPRQAPLVPSATPSANEGKPRTAGVSNRIKRVLQALHVARDLEKTVDNRLAAFRGLDQEVRDRVRRFQSLNEEIIDGAARADDILRAIEATVAAFEERAQTVSTSLGRDVAAWEAREAAVVDAVEKLGRRAVDTIDDLEGRVGDCEARAHIIEQTITRLSDVSSRTLPVLQERTKEAEEQNQSLGRLVTEAVRMATSLTALEERLPAVVQCDQELARIELAVPHIARRLEDLSTSAEQQSRALAVHQQRLRQTLDESQKTAAVVSELEGRIVDLSGSRQQLCELEQRTTSAATELKHVTEVRAGLEQGIVQLQNQLRRLTEAAEDEVKKLTTAADEETMRLDVAERHIEQLAQRAAAAAGEVRQATRAKDELEREIAKCHRQIESLTTAAQGETEKLNGLRRHAEYHVADHPSSPSARRPLNALQLGRRGPNISLRFAPTRLVFGGAALALSAAIVFLVGSVWRISPEHQRPAKPLSPRVLASRALTLAPTLPVAPLMDLAGDINHDRPEATRPAPAVPAAPVPRVVVSETPVTTSGTPTAAMREQSVSIGATAPQFVGTLLIESDPPGAAAFVNQRPVGDTPVLLKDLRAGSYVVRLEYEGYQRWSTAATVSAVREERVKATLERERR
jgi:chromosome segregation ATPase